MIDNLVERMMTKDISAGLRKGRIVIFTEETTKEEETRIWIEGMMRRIIKGAIMSDGRIEAETSEETDIMAGSEI